MYNIPRDIILWDYTWDDVQEYIGQIPIDKMMTIVPGMKESDIKKRYIESFCDPLSSEVVSQQLETKYEQFEKRLQQLKEGK